MTESDLRLILLHPEDTVLICRQPIAAGEEIKVDGQVCRLEVDLELGHKLARCDMQPNDKVRRYGVSIGSATAAIPRGAHVHVHNLKSDYIPVHLRDAVEGRL